MTELSHPLSNSCVEALNPNTTVFGDRACEEVIKVKDQKNEAYPIEMMALEEEEERSEIYQRSQSSDSSPCKDGHGEKVAM